MNSFSTATILFVDDDPCLREVMAMILNDEGYEVSTAADGFDALVHLRSAIPDLIISDLNMPRMSGFEFLSIVRHRFPAIPVIAISGACDLKESLGGGVMADAFYPKGRCHPNELMRTIHQLMHEPLQRPTNYHPCHPPRVQTARSVRGAMGTAALLLTCTDCLRAFAVTALVDADDGVFQAHCEFCKTPVRFMRDVQMQAPAQTLVAASQANLQLG